MPSKSILYLVILTCSLLFGGPAMAQSASGSQKPQDSLDFLFKSIFPASVFGANQQPGYKTEPLPLKPPEPASASITRKNVLILCYHQFYEGSGKESLVTMNGAYSVSVKNFKRQMEEIKKEKFSVISMDDYLEHLAGKKDIPEKSVIITIDDGYASVYKYAYPVLKSYKYPFTVYVYTAWIGSGGKSMTWDEIKEMEKSGLVSIGSHSRNHPYLTKPHITESPKYKEILRDEIYNSKSIIEKELGHKITTFAYPYGAYNEDAILEVIKAGYGAGVSVKSGINDNSKDEWTLKRMIIRNDTTLSKFIAILNHYPIEVDQALLTPYDGQVIRSASFTLNINITNYQTLADTPKVYINGVDHTSQLDLSRINNGIITGSISGYRKGYNMITVLSSDKQTGGYRQASWSFFAK